MRKLGLITALGLAALLPAAAPAHHKPGHTGGGGNQGNLSLGADPNPVVFGRTAALAGRLTGPNNSGQTITLQRDRFPYEGTFVTGATATTNSAGYFSFTGRPPVNTRYRVRRGGVLGPTVTVGVRIRVSRRVSDATPRRGQRIRFRGRACPQHDGALVGIQRFSGTLRRYRTIRRTRLRNIVGSRCSRYSRRFRVFRDGTYRVKVRTPHGDHLSGFSRRRRIDVH